MFALETLESRLRPEREMSDIKRQVPKVIGKLRSMGEMKGRRGHVVEGWN